MLYFTYVYMSITVTVCKSKVSLINIKTHPTALKTKDKVQKFTHSRNAQVYPEAYGVWF